MNSALDSSVAVVAYLALFATVGVLFLFVNLLVGRFVRPANPFAEKLEIYECGEPTIGSSFVQFDLRFYVVALLFIIFDVEVAFFFPWAAVFGKATNISHAREPLVALGQTDAELTASGAAIQRELGIAVPILPRDADVPAALREAALRELGPQADAAARANFYLQDSASLLAHVSLIDILVFFGVLMVGFAYVWVRGDLDWVRAVSKERAERAERPGLTVSAERSRPALTA